VSAAYGFMSSGLTGSNLPSSIGIERFAVTAGVDYRFSPTSTVGGGLGAGLGGLITVGARRFQVDPGWLVTFSYSRRLLDGTGKKPFLVLGVSAGGSGAGTREELTPAGAPPETAMLYAFDIRAGLTVGKTFWNTLSPYAALRVFGGPVFWGYDGKSVLASDLYHVQLGGGMVTALPRGFDLFAEGIPLGERAVTVGAGKTF
jgi:hypothetical protein